MFITYSCSYSFYGYILDALKVVVEAIDVTSLSWSAQESPVCACTYSVVPSIELILGIKYKLSLISLDLWRGLRYLKFPPILPWAGAYGLYVSCICITIIHTFIVRLVPVIPALNYPRAPCTYLLLQCSLQCSCDPCTYVFQWSLKFLCQKNDSWSRSSPLHETSRWLGRSCLIYSRDRGGCHVPACSLFLCRRYAFSWSRIWISCYHPWVWSLLPALERIGLQPWPTCKRRTPDNIPISCQEHEPCPWQLWVCLIPAFYQASSTHKIGLTQHYDNGWAWSTPPEA